MKALELVRKHLAESKKTKVSVEAIQEELLKRLFNEQIVEPSTRQKRHELLAQLFSPSEKGKPSGLAQKALEEAFIDLKQKLKKQTRSDRQYLSRAASLKTTDENLPPKPTPAIILENHAIVTWLSRLKLLYGVPLHYLVPHEKMLPEESIRFFHVDPNWSTALIDGAYSIGRTVEAVEVNLREILETQTNEGYQEVRDKQFGLLTPFSELENQPIITGCLIRSEMVVDYPGLEINAYEDNDKRKPIATLRMERLNPSLLICLFNGTVNYMELSEPPEGLFLGFDKQAVDQTEILKTLRNRGKDPDDMETRGLSLQGDQYKINVAMRPVVIEKDYRVVEIKKLADAIKGNAVFQDNLPNFTGADFALQMTKGVEKVVLKKQNTSKTTN
jgi:hypothetical protein